MQKYHEILKHLPATGPMYFPISEDGKPFYNEELVVRFFPAKSEPWVGNFKRCLSKYDTTFEFENDRRVCVIAGGLAYLISPDEHSPLGFFGGAITAILPYVNSIICLDGLSVLLLDSSGLVWQSPRISWDGFSEVHLVGDLLTGLAWDPTNEEDEWVSWEINLQTKHVTGGSYGQSQIFSRKNKWWKIW